MSIGRRRSAYAWCYAITNVLFPMSEQDQEWRARESAILALGAISEGCATGLTPFLPSMVQMLLPCLRDPRPMVRCIRLVGKRYRWFSANLCLTMLCLAWQLALYAVSSPCCTAAGRWPAIPSGSWTMPRAGSKLIWMRWCLGSASACWTTTVVCRFVPA